MNNYLASFLAALFLLLPSLAQTQTLQVLGPQNNIEEIELFDAKSGNYIKSISVRDLSFPLPIIKESGLGFIIQLSEGRFFVGASEVVTNKVYDSTATCDNRLAGTTGASRGIAGKGCQ